MTLDEAIAKAEYVADCRERCAEHTATKKAKESISESAAESRQLAKWLRELKEAKRILQFAWDDIQTLNDVTVDDEGNCLIEDKFESCTECPLFCESKRYCGWRYQVDALMLIGETNADQ